MKPVIVWEKRSGNEPEKTEKKGGWHENVIPFPGNGRTVTTEQEATVTTWAVSSEQSGQGKECRITMVSSGFGETTSTRSPQASMRLAA